MTQKNEKPESAEPTPQTEPTPQIGTFLTEVKAVSYPTPRFARVTFGGSDLEDFASLGPAEFVYVLLPPPGREELTIDRGFTWGQVKDMTEEERPRGAYYTVREHRPEKAELDLDFFLHSEEVQEGAAAHRETSLENSASRWAAQAKPGDRAALWGPRTLYDPPPDTGWHLLVADETGLPALDTILRSLPRGVSVSAIVQVADESEEQTLYSEVKVDISWLHHLGSSADVSTDVSTGPGSPLIQAVRNLRFPEWTRNESIYVWGAAESDTVTALRRHLRDERGLDASALSLTPYWRHTRE
jgi:NADPH-dependent ferric siderophore reductase